MCKKQTTISHSSAESEIVSLDAGLRMHGFYQLYNLESVCWEHCPVNQPRWTLNVTNARGSICPTRTLTTVCLIPLTAFRPNSALFADNAAVIRMSNKGRSPNPRHVTRNARSRVFDWLSILFWWHSCGQTIKWRLFWQKRRFTAVQWNPWLSLWFRLAQLQQSPKRCLGWWHGPRTWHGINTHQKYWNQVALWKITWLWSNWAIMSVIVLQTRGISSWDALRPESGGKPLASSKILRKDGVCETVCLFD